MEAVLAIVGSRSFSDYDLMCREIELFCPNVTKIVSGGAKGADTLGERYASEHDIPTEILLPDWKAYGKSAGILRNKDIVAASTHVIAFWDGVSPGTKHSIQEARKKKKELKLVLFKQNT